MLAGAEVDCQQVFSTLRHESERSEVAAAVTGLLATNHEAGDTIRLSALSNGYWTPEMVSAFLTLVTLAGWSYKESQRTQSRSRYSDMTLTIHEVNPGDSLLKVLECVQPHAPDASRGWPLAPMADGAAAIKRPASEPGMTAVHVMLHELAEDVHEDAPVSIARRVAHLIYTTVVKPSPQDRKRRITSHDMEDTMHWQGAYRTHDDRKADVRDKVNRVHSALARMLRAAGFKRIGAVAATFEPPAYVGESALMVDRVSALAHAWIQGTQDSTDEEEDVLTDNNTPLNDDWSDSGSDWGDSAENGLAEDDATGPLAPLSEPEEEDEDFLADVHAEFDDQQSGGGLGSPKATTAAALGIVTTFLVACIGSLQ